MNIVVAAGGAAWEAQAVAVIEASSELRLARRCVDVADLLAAASAEVAPVAVVSTSLPGLDLDVVDRLKQAGVRTIAIQEGDPQAAGRLGLGDPLAVDDLESLADLAPASTGAPQRSAPLVAVWGPTGAPGRSSVALSLASAFAASGHHTTLIDADVEGGAQAQALGLLDDVSGLIAAVRSANQGRAFEARGAAQQVEPHLSLLSGLARSDMATQLRPAAYDSVLTALQADSDIVVVDCGFSLDTERGGRGATTVATLERADEVVVVGRSEPLGLARLVRALHDVSAVVPRTPTALLNHVRRSLGWSEREVNATVQQLSGVVPTAHLPWDQAAWDKAAMRGQSVRVAAPSSPYVARIEAFAADLTSRLAIAADPAAVG